MLTQTPHSESVHYPVSRTSIQPNVVLNTGIFGTVVGSTAAMGANLHRVRNNELSMSEALADSLAKGAGAGIAAATATAAVQAVGGGRVTGWIVLLAAATGVGYVINTVGKKAAAETGKSKK
jgi:uncharacterized membrane protein (DUF4010 family)